MPHTTTLLAPVAHLVGPGVLKLVNGRLAFQPADQPPLRLDTLGLTTVYCYGEVSVTGAALEILFRHNIAAAWLSPAGHRCRGRIARTDAPTTLARLRQHRALAQTHTRLRWARLVVGAKIESMIKAARHYQRHSCSAAGPLLAELQTLLTHTPTATSLPQLFGTEGAATAAWFRFYSTLFQSPWTFSQRTRRPPTDPVNALLSLGYTFLLQRAQALAEAHGYEVYLGGLHHFRPGRPSLACDLIEPLRVPAVDRWVLAVCNQRELSSEAFQHDDETRAVRLQPNYFGRTIYSWEKHWVSAGLQTVLEQWLDRFTELVQQSAQLPSADAHAIDDL
jgi:CRISPR-associated protein Cas1